MTAFLIPPPAVFATKPPIQPVQGQRRATTLEIRRFQLEAARLKSPALQACVEETLVGIGGYIVSSVTMDAGRLSVELGGRVEVGREILEERRDYIFRPKFQESLLKLKPDWHLEKIGLKAFPGSLDSKRLNELKVEGKQAQLLKPPPTGRGAMIGVIDDGLTHHPDIIGRVTSSAQASSEELTRGPFVDELGGHGTHVCGLIVGPHGVAPAAAIAFVSLDDMVTSYGTQMSLLRALDWLVSSRHGSPEYRDVGCDAINMSFERLGDDPFLYPLFKRVFSDYGTIIVTAAGNTKGGPVASPANYDFCVTVGATDDKDEAWGFSCHGPAFPAGTGAKPEIFAPGVSIESSLPGPEGDGQLTGTSQAAPQVTAALALLLEKRPALRGNGPGLRKALLALSKPCPAGRILDVDSLFP